MGELLNMDFFNHVSILLALMLGFTCFKVANCKPFKEDGEDFSWKCLLIGTGRNLIVIFGACVVFMISCNCGAELLLIQVGDTKVTLQSAIDLTTLAILTTYGVKYVKNLAEYAGVSEKIGEVKEVEVVDYNVASDEDARG